MTDNEAIFLKNGYLFILTTKYQKNNLIMNPNLQKITDFLQQSEYLSVEERASLAKAVKDAESEMAISAFKLDRTEKVKRTTAILLEETIEELEKKREAVEAQNRELEIEFSLERVRTVAMGMRKPGDLLSICEILFAELHTMGFGELRNAMINIHNDEKGSFLNYDFSESAGATVTTILYTSHPATENLVKKVRSATDAFAEFVINGDELDQWREYRKSMGEQDDPKLNNIGQLSYYFFSIGTGAIGISTYEPISEEKRNVLKRFRNVFELAYRRYLDVTLAEAQAREAQIEAGLERFRSRMLGMQKSSELEETTTVMHKQMSALGIVPEGAMVSIVVIDKKTDTAIQWVVSDSALVRPPEGELRIPMNEHPQLIISYEAWKRKEPLLIRDISGEELDDLRDYFLSLPSFQKLKSEIDQWPERLVWSEASFSNGTLGLIYTAPLQQPTLDILVRFSKVFDLTYTRFLDIQKAEEQAREAQIQLALERVRARTMAMQRSDEMAETAAILFEQFIALGEMPERMAIEIVNEAEHVFEIWATEHGGKQFNSVIKTSLDEPYVMQKMYMAWKERNKSITIDLQGNELEEYFQYLKKMKLPVDRKIFGKRRVQNVATFSRGILTIITPEPRPRETIDILERFAAVFDGTYTRFLDLQKAEAQIREAQIEAALERVRARTMAMQHSDELAEASFLLDSQVRALGIKTRGCAFNIYGENESTEWFSSEMGTMPVYKTPREKFFLRYFEEGQTGKSIYVESFEGDACADHYDYLCTLPVMGEALKKMIESGGSFPEQQTDHVTYFKYGYLLFITLEPVPEAHDIFKRFAKVFEQTYTRFLDLQKAEAQAREAQIESALEKVRGRAMAMHNSNDLSVTASLVFTELRKLGINPLRCGVGLLVNENHKAQLYSATSSAAGDSLSLVGWVELSGHPVLQGIYDNWLKQEDYFPELTGEQLKLYYEKLLSGLSLPSVPDWTKGEKQYGHFLTFSVASLYAWSDTPYDESEIKILKRFASVIDLTFRRYIELQKSEAQAREAIKASSLDRVRAETASMRTTDDLERITPLIWNELTTQGVPFTRCGVFIMDQQQEQIHTFLSKPDGKAIAAFHLPYNTAQTTFRNLVEYWQKKQMYKEHWDEAAFINWTRNLVNSGAIAPTEKYVTGHHPTNLDLHFLPFLQGMLYVGNDNPLNEDELHLVQNLADAFSTAYARYEDFNKLESAKTQIEKTLVDLKQAQAQLVQAEKMASLGELTAGIAHEIQNPLNFVNNFSEVSTELLDEMKDELAAGNWQLAAELAEDVKQNLEKITHHGKRADAIVKGMLQHSRSSSGVKEPTDINALADEYLRLAYHGLRAKDKSFNATMKTDFDESIGTINIIPQDIGRVILNLITNAFYSVTEKNNRLTKDLTGLNNYEPTVSLRTKRTNGRVEVFIKDNGNGIPQNVLDKIFQPFFTTKPTGQGTGLGLSMSFDIVKAHGGELKADTIVGEYAEFIIQLPVK